MVGVIRRCLNSGLIDPTISRTNRPETGCKDAQLASQPPANELASAEKPNVSCQTQSSAQRLLRAGQLVNSSGSQVATRTPLGAWVSSLRNKSPVDPMSLQARPANQNEGTLPTRSAGRVDTLSQYLNQRRQENRSVSPASRRMLERADSAVQAVRKQIPMRGNVQTDIDQTHGGCSPSGLCNANDGDSQSEGSVTKI